MRIRKDEHHRGDANRLFATLGADVKSRSIVIEHVSPEVDCGKFPVKREVGDYLQVSATVFRDGHDKLKVVLLFRRKDTNEWHEIPMKCVNPGLDLWTVDVPLTENAVFVYTIEAWTDVYESWCSELTKKRDAGQDVSLELVEGWEILEDTTKRATGADAKFLKDVLARYKDADYPGRIELMLGDDVRAVTEHLPDRATAVRYDHDLTVVVDRPEARFAAWYEMFHRSQGTEPGKSATFADCEARLDEVKWMGFDVVYLLPVHPIGKVNRKGPNNTLNAGPGDPGSPYAIGSEVGGHKDINPELGTLKDFRHFVKACRDRDMEVAIDFAIQCAPDHPWIKEHPEWFLFRPDGTIKYAENPPKKYQDIVNVDFFCDEWESLWKELKSVVDFWIEQGVTIFRVDNPHTKAVPFWEWLISETKLTHPEILFLAEAFTRPPMMRMLAKAGFEQSYTYFTWRNNKAELTEYLTELTQTELVEYMRPNFFTCTPDINPPYLQTGGRPAHMIRLVLAATLSSVYGIYNGFELCEATPIPGKEEYLNSEKYDYKVWDWDRPGNIKEYIARVNEIRKQNPALHELENLRFYPSSNDGVLFYGKMSFDRTNMIFIAVNLDPFSPNEAHVDFPLADMYFGEGDTFHVEELFSHRHFDWRGDRHWIRLDPQVNPCEIFKVYPRG